MALIRPATVADAAAWAEIEAASTQYYMWDARTQTWAFENAAPAQEAVTLEVDGEIVGFAKHRPEGRQGGAHLVVHPDHRRRGYGGQLMSWVLDRYAQKSGRGVRGLVTEIKDDEGSRAAATAWGFRPGVSTSISVTDPSGIPPPGRGPAGTTVVPLLDLAPERVWWAMVESDEPDPTGLASTPPYDAFLKTLWSHPLARLDLGRAVLVDDRVASVTFVDVGRMNRAWSRATSTIPAFRGQGLATLAKHHALCATAAAGVTQAFTTNLPQARAIAAVNEHFGYRHVASPAFGWRWLKHARVKRWLTGR